ncbi:GNAT family N-acetyltransferase [Pseudoalteromonas byunsanensis]|uniref:GNAT family N-acetyltransferase n=1 Tax=Pseudoalteromonas byunsanensis TaxID=327939 RepID=A0A1S1N284_9GAMM|nr:GNAT family N-acetyltransferase [Pseudoalteromonas byunsanensis]OHU93564.1 GNAT family N-acetyltransferase [Pseudoalteromonas byunsanensis]
MQPTITTKRLLLRPFNRNDAATVARLAGDKRVSDMTKNIPYPYSEDMAVDWICSHESEYESGRSVVYAITLKSDDAVIGALGFVEITDNVGTLGYWLGCDYWGQGITPEAVNGMVNYYKEHHNLKGLAATHFVENHRSRAVIGKLGLSYVEDTEIELQGKQRAISVHRMMF